MRSEPFPVRYVKNAGYILLLWSVFYLLGTGMLAAAQQETAIDAAPWRYFAAHGTRGFVGGNNAAGVDAYIYPLQLFRGLQVSFRIGNASSALPGATLIRSMNYTPSSIQRHYEHKQFKVTERLVMAHDEPAGVLEYALDSSQPVTIELSFVPVLNLMWPGGIGGQEIHWQPAFKAYLLNEPTGRMVGLVGSSDVSFHEALENSNAPTDSETRLHLRLAQGKQVRIFFAASNKGYAEAAEAFRKVSEDPARWLDALEKRETMRRAQTLEILTPSREVNEALAWSALALDQAWACNPDLGCGLVGGYGPSRGISQRPQYAWFFAGDGLVSLPAMLEAGYFERAREELLFILRYQDKQRGMIWHELSQSAAYLRWGGDYPYEFAHVDITPAFLTGMANYVRATGDVALVSDHWEGLVSAYGYVTGLLNSIDGLPRIPPEREGHDEQGRPPQELATSLDCLHAARAFSFLAAGTGHSAESKLADQAALRLQMGIVPRYWNNSTNFWNSGLTADGAPARTVRLPPAASLELLSPAQRMQVLARVDGPSFQTAWGVRTVATDSPVFEPTSYATGSVWATSTSVAAAMMWHYGQPASAWSTWQKLLPWLNKDSVGHIHEAMSGEDFRPQRESVPEQTWSSALLLSSFVEGVLGVEYDAGHRRLLLTPRLPDGWSEIHVNRLRIGKSAIDVTLQRERGQMFVTARATGEPFQLSLPAELLGADKRLDVTVNGHRCALQKREERCSVLLKP